MPLRQYDHLVAGSRSKAPGAARKAFRKFKARYGPERGEQYFYGWLNKRRRARAGKPHRAYERARRQR